MNFSPNKAPFGADLEVLVPRPDCKPHYSQASLSGLKSSTQVYMTTFEELATYRRAVAGLYTVTRDRTRTPAERCARFRTERDHLFREHPQSALSAEQKVMFTGLDYFPYDPSFRFAVPVDAQIEPQILEVDLADDGLFRMQRFGCVRLPIAGQVLPLSIFWLLGYGGGMFLPFRDLTNNHVTYGGGRYLLDTIKHADLGHEDGKLVLDFNFAYNPSCAYHSRWTCPLALAENRLPVELKVGEKIFAHAI